ncbi:MAG TPA: XrtA/PEP-CTERM system histidine kinase PrsK [Casimicrobiaceae bacterium]
MTPDSFAVLAASSFGIAAAGYAGFALRAAVGRRRSLRGWLLVAALVVTALWALACLWVALAPDATRLFVSNLLNALRYAAWFVFVGSLLVSADVQEGWGALPRRSAAAIAIVVALALVAGVLLADGSPLAQWGLVPSPRAAHLVRLGIAVFGLVLVEHLVRRVRPEMRWGVKPLAIALAAVFGFDLFYYADAALFGQLDPVIWAARGFANALVIPLIAIATARNTGWTVDLHLSRGAVMHSSALVVSGVVLLLVAGAGYYVRYFGGDWGRALQIELVFAAAVAIAVVITSGRFRSRLKVFVSKHFFSYRFDYRQEWLRFTRTLAEESAGSGLPDRAIAALANLVESPAGALWMKDESRGYVCAARWNVPQAGGTEAAEAPFARFLAETGWIVSVPELRATPARYRGIAVPAWLESLGSAWLVVPLAAEADELLGWVVLTTPRATIDVDWEVRDLLKTASRQAASYLAQMRATEALVDARKFEAFNRMSAFVVHDLKNLVAQLSLMLKNAERHRDNPKFQADMLATVEHVVGRMNSLMLQLRVGATPIDAAGPVDLPALARRVVATKSGPGIGIAVEATGPVAALGHEDRLEHVIGHLIQNAIDASPTPGEVRVRVGVEANRALLEVHDHGTGMSPEFVRERLFKPFQTTKPTGMGIGVYESSQYVAGLGGNIAVDSAPGKGTRVFLRLPLAAARTVPLPTAEPTIGESAA